MALSYPLALPSGNFRRAVFRGQSVVGMSQSPFSGSQQSYVWPGAWFEADVELPPMARADAEEWVGLLLGLNGMEGSVLFGDPLNISPRGTWSGGTPLLVGAHAAGARTLSVDGLGSLASYKAGDWFQLGTTSSSRLHKVVQSGAANSGGAATLEIFPPARVAYADNAALTLASPKGLFRLASNARQWSIELARVYGLSFSVIEDLRGI